MASQKTILVVEDNEDLRFIFVQALTFAGFHVRQANDGLAALRYLDSEHPPDLVVLDLFLPTISGFVVAQDIEARAELQHVPVVVVTAATPEQTGHLDVPCLLRKPVMPDELVAAVRKCL